MTEEMRLKAIREILLRVLRNNGVERSVRHDVVIAFDYARGLNEP